MELLRVAALWAMFIVLAVVAHPANSMRCGNGLVLVGDSVYKVIQLCGQPEYQTPDHLYYKEGGGINTVTMAHDKVTSIEFNI